MQFEKKKEQKNLNNLNLGQTPHPPPLVNVQIKTDFFSGYFPLAKAHQFKIFWTQANSSSEHDLFSDTN